MKGSFLKLETNCTQFSIMTRGEMKGFRFISEHQCTWFIKLSLSLSLCLSFSFTGSPIFDVPPLFSPPGWQMGSSDSHSSEECPPQVGYTGLHPSSSGSEEGSQELLEMGVQPRTNPPSLEQQSPAHFTGNRVNIMVSQHQTLNPLGFLTNLQSSPFVPM